MRSFLYHRHRHSRLVKTHILFMSEKLRVWYTWVSNTLYQPESYSLFMKAIWADDRPSSFLHFYSLSCVSVLVLTSNKIHDSQGLYRAKLTSQRNSWSFLVTDSLRFWFVVRCIMQSKSDTCRQRVSQNCQI